MDINYIPLQRIMHKKYYDNKNHSSLYHYTSADGLNGIIRPNGNMSFWFTRSDCLNDISEGIYLDDLFQKISLELFSNKAISKEFYNILNKCKAPAHRVIHFPLPPREGEDWNSQFSRVDCEAYICCFSLCEDSLDMWRYYSKSNGGYALKLLPFVFDEQINFNSFEYEEHRQFSYVKEYKVLYDLNLQIRIIKEFITECYAAFCIGNTNKESDAHNVKTIVNDFLIKYQYVFKHPCFENEHEYRYVFYRPIEKPKEMTNELPMIKFRTQCGMITPYIEIEVDNASVDLEGIMISPLLKDDNVIKRTKSFLIQNGYEKCIVEKSKLPIR